MLVGLDVGTQGTKAVLYDPDTRQVVSRASVSYGLLPTDVPGRAEQDPEVWWSSCKQAIKKLTISAKDGPLIKGIGVSGQQHGLVAMDDQGQVIRPAKLWCDVESSEEAAEITKTLGYVLVPSYTLPKILWMKNNEPHFYSKLKTVLLPHDYINFRLTGRMCMECGDASGIGAFDTPNRQIDNEILSKFDPDLVHKFPPLVSPDEAIGEVKSDVAEELGLQDGVVVSPGSGDNMMSALGSGAVTEGILVLSLGTSGTLFGCSSIPIEDRSGVICPFCDATGKWMPLVCTISCGEVVEEVKQCFGLSHNELTDLAERESAGCDGANFLPYLRGERTPNWPDAKGCLMGLKPGSLKPGLVYRTALEGVTFTMLNGLRGMEAKGLVPKELRLVGGGSKNRLWRRIIADCFQIPLRFPTEPESAALGAALQAGAIVNGSRVDDYVLAQEVPLSDEIVHPEPKMAQIYAEAFERHVSLGRTLFA